MLMKIGDRCVLTAEGQAKMKKIYDIDLEVGTPGTVVDVVRRPIPYHVKFDIPILVKGELKDTFWQDCLHIDKVIAKLKWKFDAQMAIQYAEKYERYAKEANERAGALMDCEECESEAYEANGESEAYAHVARDFRQIAKNLESK